MGLFQLWLTLLALIGTRSQDIASDYFCSTNLKQESSGPDLAFSKELNVQDFARKGEYKGLRCCVRNYDTIDWYKDGVPIENLQRNSSLTFVHLLEQNQSLTSLRVSLTDNGNYTCIATREMETITHSIMLSVTENGNYQGPPEATIIPEDQWALPGESARFCCEAYIGYGKLSQDFSMLVWMVADSNWSFVKSDVKNANESSYKKENGSIMGAFLIFDSVTEEDYRTYSCHVSNSWGEPKVFNATLHKGLDPNMKIQSPFKITVSVLVLVVIILVLLIGIYLKWHLELHLFWKDSFGKLEENDSKLFDVFVCYDRDDSEFVFDVLVPVLEKQFNYTTFTWERDVLAGDWIPQIYTEMVRSSRRFLLVLSPALANNTWCTYALYVAVENMLSEQARIICITLQNIRWGELTLVDGDRNNPTLRKVLRVVKSIKWDPGESGGLPAGSNKFWKRLCLYLPPRRVKLHRYNPDPDSASSSKDSLLVTY